MNDNNREILDPPWIFYGGCEGIILGLYITAFILVIVNSLCGSNADSKCMSITLIAALCMAVLAGTLGVMAMVCDWVALCAPEFYERHLMKKKKKSI